MAVGLLPKVEKLSLHQLLGSDQEQKRLPAEEVNRFVDRELTKVLVEMDIRNPSPEHEAFLREYDLTQNRCEKGEQ